MKISDIITETTTSGAIATSTATASKMLRRPNPSVFPKRKKKTNESDRQLVRDFFPKLDQSKDTYKGIILQDILAHVHQTFPDGRKCQWRRLKSKLQTMNTTGGENIMHPFYLQMLDTAVDSLKNYRNPKIK